MEQMYRDGVREVLVQPTHIIHGLEYEKMRSQLAPYQERFSLGADRGSAFGKRQRTMRKRRD